MWEVMTLAMVPYPGVSNKDVVAFLKSGSRLEKPDECPTEMWVFSLVVLMWATVVISRLQVPYYVAVLGSGAG